MQKKKKQIGAELEIPEGITIEISKDVKVKGPKGELTRRLYDPIIFMKVEEGKVKFNAKKNSKREKRQIGTFKAHIKNMFKGVGEGHVYKLKICSGHFPMNVSAAKGEFVVKNFLGEKVPRTVKIIEGVDVKLDGEIVIVESLNKEHAGQTAADIEQLCRITNRDRRIFQDGIYITNKDGKEIK